VSPATLRARAAAYFVAPKAPAAPTADLIPLVHREPPPRCEPPPGHAAANGVVAPRDDAASHGLGRDGAPHGLGAPLRDAAPHDLDHPLGHAALHVDDFIPPAAPPVIPASSAPGGTIGSAGRAAVLGPASGAVPAAAALACALRAARRDPAAVVATWTPGESPRAPRLRGPATPAAARIAGRLEARGLAATAHGRLAWMPLTDHVVAASVAARRAAAALDVPLVIALAGPRCDIVEALLAEQDLVLVVAADPDGPLARLAVARFRQATACAPLQGVRRALALAGLAGADLSSRQERR
jgi:hypothetical protein